ncbi:hypothetical protein J3B00_003328 [Pseudomonas sp. BP8]|nr:hypothetical protein [Pseudomonas sp. BP8]
MAPAAPVFAGQARSYRVFAPAVGAGLPREEAGTGNPVNDGA